MLLLRLLSLKHDCLLHMYVMYTLLSLCLSFCSRLPSSFMTPKVKARQRRTQKAKAEQQRYEERIERDARAYNPFGKGGSGAPLRDQSGRVVANFSDLRRGQHDNTQNMRRPQSSIVNVQNAPNDDITYQAEQHNRMQANQVRMYSSSLTNPESTERKRAFMGAVSDMFTQRTEQERQQQLRKKQAYTDVSTIISHVTVDVYFVCACVCVVFVLVLAYNSSVVF